MRSPVRGSLERHLPKAPLSDEEMFAMRRAAWQTQGIVVVQPADIHDAWTRQALVNEAVRLYGRREAVMASQEAARGVSSLPADAKASLR